VIGARLVGRLALAYATGLAAYAGLRSRPDPIELVDDLAPWLHAPAPVLLMAGLLLHSWTIGAAGLVGIAAFWNNWGRRYLPPRPEAPPIGAPVLTFMTFNVLARNERHDATAGAIREADPDVVAIQELTPGAATALAGLLHRRYPHWAVRPAPSPAGTGVFSRFPIREASAFRLSEQGHWCQRMLIDAPGGTLDLFNVHPRIPNLGSRRLGKVWFPTCYEPGRRRAEIGRLLCLLPAERPLVVLGDFNVTESSPEYRLLRARLGDAYRAVGRGLGHTFPSLLSLPPNFPALWPVLRLDYVWHSAHFRPLSARHGRSGGSDHRPVVVRLARTP